MVSFTFIVLCLDLEERQIINSLNTDSKHSLIHDRHDDSFLYDYEEINRIVKESIVPIQINVNKKSSISNVIRKDQKVELNELGAAKSLNSPQNNCFPKEEIKDKDKFIIKIGTQKSLKCQPLNWDTEYLFRKNYNDLFK